MKDWRLAIAAVLALTVLTGCGQDKVVKVEGKEDGVYKKSIDKSRNVAAQGTAAQRYGEATLSGEN